MYSSFADEESCYRSSAYQTMQCRYAWNGLHNLLTIRKDDLVVLEVGKTGRIQSYADELNEEIAMAMCSVYGREMSDAFNEVKMTIATSGLSLFGTFATVTRADSREHYAYKMLLAIVVLVHNNEDIRPKTGTVWLRRSGKATGVASSASWHEKVKRRADDARKPPDAYPRRVFFEEDEAKAMLEEGMRPGDKVAVSDEYFYQCVQVSFDSTQRACLYRTLDCAMDRTLRRMADKDGSTPLQSISERLLASLSSKGGRFYLPFQTKGGGPLEDEVVAKYVRFVQPDGEDAPYLEATSAHAELSPEEAFSPTCPIVVVMAS